MKLTLSLLVLLFATLLPVLGEETPAQKSPEPNQPADETPAKGWSVKRKKESPAKSAGKESASAEEAAKDSTPSVEGSASQANAEGSKATPAASDEAAVAKPVVSAKPRPVYIVPIEGAIDDPIAFILRRAIKESSKEENPVLILDIKTPGGSLGTTLDMLEMLDRFPGETIAYVNDEAMSAGAIISSVCHHIYYAPKGIIGAAAVVDGSGQEIDATMKLKINSFMNAKMRAYTGKNRYRAEVLRAMMDSEYELVIDGVTIKPKGELLSFTAEEAVKKYGTPPQDLFGAGIAETKEALMEARYGKDGYVVRQFEVTWSENLAKFMSSIAPILMGLAFMLLFIEFKTPGFGIFGALGIALLLIVFAGSFVTGLAGYEPIILFFVGVVLIGVELFVLPGLVIMASVGTLCIIASLVWALADFWPSMPPGTPGMPQNAFDITILMRPLRDVMIGLALGVVGIIALWRILPKTSFYSRLVLEAANNATATSIGDIADNASTTVHLPAIGAQGVAVSDLRPGGDVEIDGKRYRAQLSYGMARRGDAVEVIEHRDLSLVVKAR